jgi:hypothetical protein
MSENVSRSPIGNQRPRKPARGLLGQVSTIVFQPAKFFAEMPRIQDNRQWAWIGLFILIILGLNVVQQNDINTDSSPDVGFNDPFSDPMMMGGMAMDMMATGDPFMSGDMGILDGTSTGGNGVSTSTKWEMGLVAGAGMVFIWFAQAFVLSQVSLFKGKAPIWSDNLQIVIWSAIPLGLMALFQMFFRWTGGEIGQSGLSGLLIQTSFYQSANPFLQAVLHALASNLTLFWVWSMILIYVGARHVLHGQPIPSILAVVMWVVLMTTVPAIINPPETEAELSTDSMGDFGGDFGAFEEFPFDAGMDDEFEPFTSDEQGFSEGNFSEEMPQDELQDPLNDDLDPLFDRDQVFEGENQDIETPVDESIEETPFDEDFPLDEETPLTDEANK